MDHMLAMALAALGALGWYLGAIKKRAQWWALFGAVPGILWLVFYMLIEGARANPEIWTGDAQAGWVTIAFMAGGVCALLSKSRPEHPHHGHHGGARAA